MKTAFLNEEATKKELAEFIVGAKQFSMNAQCAEFERVFAAYQGRRHAILFNSGGSANLALLQALKNISTLSNDDRIGFSALTWSTNVMPILQLGMVPVPVDCEPTTLNVMARTLADRLKTTSMRALFITNALGLTGDLDRIRALCDERGIVLLEDNCESLGSETRGGKAGNFGLASTFSFFVAHHMSTIEGGMACTDDDDLAEMLRIVRANGWDRNLTPDQQRRWRERYEVGGEFNAKYTFYDLGYNLRPTEITGFLGQAQLRYLDENIRVRGVNHAALEEVLVKNADLIPLDHSHMSVFSSFATVVLCKTPALRDAYVDRFEKAGVEVRPVIAGNIQRQPFYHKYVGTQYEVAGAEFVHRCGFYFGNYPELTPDDIAILRACLAGRGDNGAATMGRAADTRPGAIARK